MMLSWLKSHLVADWRDFHKWASMRLNGLAVIIATIYQVMPVLDPQIAAMLPAPLVAKAIGAYALFGAMFRVIQFKPATPAPPPSA